MAPKQQKTKMGQPELLEVPEGKKLGSVFEIPLSYRPEVPATPKPPQGKFIPSFSLPNGAGQNTRQLKPALHSEHRAITVESNGKKCSKIIVEVNFKWESPVSVLRENGPNDCRINYDILGALKQYKDSANHVTITIFYQHVDEETAMLKREQSLYLNKLVNILKDFKISFLKIAISTQTGKEEFSQTKDFSCFYRLQVPIRELWLSIKDGKDYKQISMTSPLARRIDGVVKAKANKVQERKEQAESTASAAAAKAKAKGKKSQEEKEKGQTSAAAGTGKASSK
ncbi:hypothetical protein HYFRA_00011125 [Hymenoscyphus fraxineus]|uniref:Uncharacterized protein n=1 Tax=Hymenoscyphus fraxineus TaxID=746836 RepID=A0A9N9PX34_9HELO|nr:hypothetical protein HYFRA_00011125 [Hymenoscyphus fraxineus]